MRRSAPKQRTEIQAVAIMSQQEVAKKLGISYQSVQQHENNALAKIRKAFFLMQKLESFGIYGKDDVKRLTQQKA